MNSLNNYQSSRNYSAPPLSVQTVIRVRPFLKRERDDPEVLTPLDATTIVMGPQPAVQMLSPSSALVKQTIDPENNHDEGFLFDLILKSNSTQEDMYFSFGSNIAQQAMEPLKASKENSPLSTSLLIAMGLSNSGKTFSCWGDHCLSTHKLPQDGMLPRILDSLFAQSVHFVEKKQGLSFGVQISVVQVNHRDGILNDLLKSSSRRSIRSTMSSLSSRRGNGSSPFPSHNSVVIEQDPTSLECRLQNQQRKLCLSWEEARLALKKAVKVRHDNAKPGHGLVEVRPVMVNRSQKVVEKGGLIALLEMESLDKGKKIKAGRIKDSIPNRTDAYGSVMRCLKVALDNQNDPSHATNVPFVQHKVTMMLQSMFSRENTDATDVTVLVTAYPGDRDYLEKKELLRDLQPLRQKRKTNAACTESSSDRSTVSEQEDFRTHLSGNRMHKNIRKHSHDFSSGGESKGMGGKNAPVVSRTTTRSFDRDLLLKRMDSSVEDIVPLPPPPVAPGYRSNPNSLVHEKSQKSNTSPHQVAVRKASAPVEETMASPETSRTLTDFPGVFKRNHTGSHSEYASGSPADQQTDGDDESYINFSSDEADSYHIDKKEELQTAFSTVVTEQRSGCILELHDNNLKAQVEALSKENAYLRAENERIKHEFTYLKQSLQKSGVSALGLKSLSKNATASSHAKGFHGRFQWSTGAERSSSARDTTKEPLASDITNRYL